MLRVAPPRKTRPPDHIRVNWPVDASASGLAQVGPGGRHRWAARVQVGQEPARQKAREGYPSHYTSLAAINWHQMKTAGRRLWGSNQSVCTRGRLQHCGLINTSHKHVYIDSSAAEVPVKFQSDWTILTANLAASRLHEILQIRCLIGYWVLKQGPGDMPLLWVYA